MTDADPGLLEIAEGLYGLPLAEFTAGRDARARALKGQALAGSVKALRKPATAAWVVDLLVRRENEQVTQMIAVGDALRRAQEGMDGAALRELTKQRRQLTAALTLRARALARSVGLRVTEQVAEQVEETLTAAMIDPIAAQAVRSGLLVTPLRATGIGSVDAAAAVAVPDALGFTAAPVADPPVTLHVVRDPDAGDRSPEVRSTDAARAKALAAARAELAEASEALSEAESERDQAAAEVERLRARSLQVQAEIDEIRRRLAELETAAQEVDDELADAEDLRTEAESELQDAVRRRDGAAGELARLEG